jgi:hypothetical protein
LDVFFLECNDNALKVVALVLGIVMLSATCHRREAEMVPIGPDVKYGLVIFFRVDATHDQIESFWAEVLSYPTQGGHWTRPGVGGILRLAAVHGHEAVAVSFFPNATEAEREDIKSRVHSSPLVYKVMENVVPQNIKKVD